MSAKNHPTITVSVCTAAIIVADAAAVLATDDDEHTQGAAVYFVGRVRGGEVLAMRLEHYPAMTEASLTQIAQEAARRWELKTVSVIHRVGRLLPGEVIVFVGVQSPHRAAAFSACAYITDYLKTAAPFWKKEETADGARWVKARAQDEAARCGWDG